MANKSVFRNSPLYRLLNDFLNRFVTVAWFDLGSAGDASFASLPENVGDELRSVVAADECYCGEQAGELHQHRECRIKLAWVFTDNTSYSLVNYIACKILLISSQYASAIYQLFPLTLGLMQSFNVFIKK